jgi:flagellar hook-associated protein FlgK
VDALIQQRDALVLELKSLSSVDVIQRSDGTVRVRTTEGNTLVDSGAVSDGRTTAELLPAPPPIDPEPTTVTREAASVSYRKLEGAISSESSAPAVREIAETPSTSAKSEVLPDSTGIPSVDRVADLESKTVVLEQVEAVISDSMSQLGALQSHQGDIDALIG